MTFLKNIFEIVLQMSLMGSFAVCVALLFRPLLLSLPRIYSYILWLVIFVRLLVPVLPESRLSLIPASLSSVSLSETYTIPETEETPDHINNVPAHSTTQDIEDNSPVSDTQPAASITKTENSIQNSPFSMNRIFTIAPWIWGIGFAGFLLFHFIRFLRLYQLTRQAQHCEKNIYRMNDIPSSFVFGLLRPRIYISADMAESAVPYVLCHEGIHIKRRDYLIKPLCLFILCLHWFNPLVWLAFYLCSRDMEMSCDEQTIRIMGMEAKAGYSDALLQAATEQGSLRGPYPAFSSNEVKKRIKNVLEYKKRPVVVIGITALLIAVLSIGLLMNPFRGTPTASNKSQILSLSPGDIVTVSRDANNSARDLSSHSTGVTTQLIDLDRNGTAEMVKLSGETDKYGIMQHGYDLQVDDSSIQIPYSNTAESSLIFYALENLTLIGVYDGGPSGDPGTYFYRYNNGEILSAGIIPGDIRTLDIDKSGIICCSSRADVIQTRYALTYAYWDGSMFTMRQDEIYEYQDWPADSPYPVLLEEIPVYPAPDETLTPYMMQPQEIIDERITASDWTGETRWIYLRGLEDDTAGWVKVEDSTINGKDIFELFNRLNNAG